MALCVFLATLKLSTFSAPADEQSGGVQSALNSATISGYVESSAAWEPAFRARHGFREWLRQLLHALGVAPKRADARK